MNNLQKRQRGFRPMIPMKNKNEYAERPILKVLDVPEKTEHGTSLWHINHLCGVLDYLGVGTTEYNYIKELIEHFLLEHETTQDTTG